MKYQFEYDERLGIRLPNLMVEWEDLNPEERNNMIMEWEQIKAKIPDRIMVLEKEIISRQLLASQVEDWDRICNLYGEIYNLASIINDLHIWERVEQDFDPEPETGV